MRSTAALAAVVVAVGLGAAGCDAPTAAPPPAAPTSSVTVPPTASGGVGLDITYLDEDGTLKTLRVEDFPR